MPRHTPGPWHRNIKPAKKYNTIFSGRNTHVAHLATQGLTDEEVEGNCELIRLAPEMADLLREAAELMPLGTAKRADWLVRTITALRGI